VLGKNPYMSRSQMTRKRSVPVATCSTYKNRLRAPRNQLPEERFPFEQRPVPQVLCRPARAGRTHRSREHQSVPGMLCGLKRVHHKLRIVYVPIGATEGCSAH
jgi:hypothetical protein